MQLMLSLMIHINQPCSPRVSRGLLTLGEQTPSRKLLIYIVFFLSLYLDLTVPRKRGMTEGPRPPARPLLGPPPRGAAPPDPRRPARPPSAVALAPSAHGWPGGRPGAVGNASRRCPRAWADRDRRELPPEGENCKAGASEARQARRAGRGGQPGGRLWACGRVRSSRPHVLADPRLSIRQDRRCAGATLEARSAGRLVRQRSCLASVLPAQLGRTTLRQQSLVSTLI